MTSSKKRTYMALMSVGAAALFVDRCVLTDGAPTRASAGEAGLATSEKEAPVRRSGIAAPSVDTPPAGLDPRTGAALPSTAAEVISIPELPFPRNLKPLDPAVPLRDIFARPHTVQTAAPTEDTDDKGQPSLENGEPRPMGRAAFFAQHRLGGVIVERESRVAIVNGRWMRIGDAVGGCTLSDIAGESAVFHCRDGDVLLSPFERTPRREP